ncbi:unnamed protein product [Caenorhabditis auriculariae]|uniref:Uncharacterized protein n=1 Tax=Caenorhabditis auriculariae TaxID=2777116 RepID=A0A8S1H690_9PELO|nr:unnamed protein product [Caenorhabditis auriculariae]
MNLSIFQLLMHCFYPKLGLLSVSTTLPPTSISTLLTPISANRRVSQLRLCAWKSMLQRRRRPKIARAGTENRIKVIIEAAADRRLQNAPGSLSAFLVIRIKFGDDIGNLKRRQQGLVGPSVLSLAACGERERLSAPTTAAPSEVEPAGTIKAVGTASEIDALEWLQGSQNLSERILNVRQEKSFYQAHRSPFLILIRTIYRGSEFDTEKNPQLEDLYRLCFLTQKAVLTTRKTQD